MAETLRVPPEGILQAWAQYTTLMPSVLPQMTAAKWQVAQEQDLDVRDVLHARCLGPDQPPDAGSVTPMACLLLQEWERL